MKLMTACLFGMLAIVLVCATAAPAQEMAAKPAAVNPGFEKLKKLLGEWTMETPQGPALFTYKLTSAGSAVVETLFAGTEHEMVTVYYLDGNDLVLTHYCAEHNQPHMRAQPGGDEETLVFKFDGGTNIDPAKTGHMHDAVITFVDDDTVRCEWSFYENGSKKDAAIMKLTRKKS
ncbi:MAG: hypothetical protein AB1714_20030 [Acidobacteriota bacterium]